MKTLFVLSFFLWHNIAYADTLGQKLNGMLHSKSKHENVNLDYLNLDTPRMKHKTFGAKEVVASYKKLTIQKYEADKYLKKITRGEVKDFNKLQLTQRRALMEEIFQNKLIVTAAKNTFSQEEQNEIFKGMWLAKKRKSVEVSSEELMALYEKKKAQSLKKNPAANIPNYMSVGPQLRQELMENKILSEIMKDITVELIEE